MKSFLCNYIYLTILVLLTMAAAACSDEIKAPPKSKVPEGLPATLSMKVDMLDRAVISRSDGRGEIPDQRITSLWIGLFNAHTGEKKDFFSFTDDTDDTFEENWRHVKISTTSGVTRVVGVANFENRFAVVKDGDGVKLVSLMEALNAIESFEDFENMAVTFNERAEISTSEPLNALLMTGRYSEHYSDGESHNGIIPEEDTFVITPGNYSAPGCIHLRRLISQNKFNITYNTENIKSFKIIEWQAHNVPNSSWLRERNNDDSQLNSGEVYNINGVAVTSSERFNVITTKDNVISFDYWQLENLHTGLEPAESDKSAAGDYYAYREREHKNEENGESTGVFSSLTATNNPDDYNNNASYLTFNVEMEMNVDENGIKLDPNGVSSRIVQAIYTVHLGYCENKSDKKKQAMDFNCRRNAKYTYNITINNVNSMMVEALREGEPTPSIIGDITDSNQASTKLDCHYNVTNLYFTQKELEEFKFATEAFGSAGERKFYTQNNYPSVSDDDFRFYSWIELRPTTNENTIAEYKPHTGDYADGKTYYLHEMKGKSAGWYTMFINEYVYEDFNDDGSIKPADKYNWQWYCGAPDRRVWFNINAQVSADGHTSYYSSKYAFSQTSIQTYYDKSQDIAALGVEHVNESLGINIRNNWNNGKDLIRTGAGYEGTSGRYNLGQYLMGATPRGSAKSSWGKYAWSDHLNVNKLLQVNEINNQGYVREKRTEHIRAYNFKGTTNGAKQESNTSVSISYNTTYDVDQTKSPQYMEMVTACLNRNRDNNGDGYIDKNEIRWFVPSDFQVIRVILGRQALRSPIMDYDGITAKINTSNELNSRFLIACANGKILWAMEGLSTSAWYPSWSPKTQAPWNVRCVRYMGADIADFNIETRVHPPYDRDPDNQNIILMDRMDNRALRIEAYRDSKYPMPPHVLNDQVYNRCFKKFEIHPDEVIVLNSDNVGTTQMYLSDYLSQNNPCEKLKDKKGKDGWRVPNQKELTIMSTYQKPGSTSYYYSNEGTGVTYLVCCSFTYFDNSGAPASQTNPVNFQNHLSLKITTDTGQGTQSSTNNSNGVKTDRVPNTSIGVRCVRDVP